MASTDFQPYYCALNIDGNTVCNCFETAAVDISKTYHVLGEKIEKENNISQKGLGKFSFSYFSKISHFN